VKRGFTLVELAVVLVVVGLLLGSGVSLAKILLKNSKIKENRSILARDASAVIGYAISKGRLPSEEMFESTVPFIKDAYGKPIRYIASENGDICGGDSGLEIVLCQTKECKEERVFKNAGFVLISPSEDRKFDYKISGGRLYLYSNLDSYLYYGVYELRERIDCKRAKFDSQLPIM